MFDIFYSGKKPGLFAHEREADSIEHAQKLSRTRYFWWVNYLIDYTDWDFLYEPPPWQSQYTHVWPSRWPEFYSAYLVPTHSDIKFHFHSYPLPTRQFPENYCQIVTCDFDKTWVPHPWDPPYIYVFGNQWHSSEIMPTIEYHVPGATERKYMDWPLATLPPNPANWTVPNGIDLDTVDMSWVPDPGSPPYVYQFGTQHQKTGGPVYTVPGATEVTYVDYPRVTKVSVDPCWEIPNGANTESFDWTWHPDATEPPYIYQFATQHQKTGGPVYTVPGATEIKYLEHIEIKIAVETVPIIEIDHMDGNGGQVPNAIKKVRYFDNYRDTLIRLAKSLKGQHEFVWVCSSICDYSDFDFTWHPEKWQGTMLHVFASDEQKFGDTFYMHVPTFADRAEKKALLEWYSVNYVPRKSVPRRPMPVFLHNNDSQVDAVKNIDFSAPLALFTTEEHLDRPLVTVPLWRKEVKTITPISKGATAVIVPRVAVGDIQTQLYDYPNIDKTKIMLKSQPLDIVFISNGESNAEQNYRWLIAETKANMNSNLNKIHRVDGINGRVAAYHAAARASTTPWFFAVFAKLEVNPKFDWTWQPDRMQQAKHYIFHARNPVNGLEYGHQAMIAYNKKMVLENIGQGLDFTLDQAHEVVPILSGTAQYQTSDWMCWRTAFREALKLRASLPDVENEYRLQQWLTKDNTPGQWSRWGAMDAIEYYDSVSGEFAELKKSYDWEWLASYAFVKRGLSPHQ